MKWNVYHYNINKRKVESYNIFDHYSFREYVKKAIKKHLIKEDFEEQLKSELRYYYWCKAEWEVIVAPWVGGDREKDKIKIDVYNQVMLNWDVFVNYVWDNRKELLENNVETIGYADESGLASAT